MLAYVARSMSGPNAADRERRSALAAEARLRYWTCFSRAQLVRRYGAIVSRILAAAPVEHGASEPFEPIGER